MSWKQMKHTGKMTRLYLSMSEGDTPKSLLGFLMKAVASSCVASGGGPDDADPLTPAGVAAILPSDALPESGSIFSRTSCCQESVRQGCTWTSCFTRTNWG